MRLDEMGGFQASGGLSRLTFPSIFALSVRRISCG
jgi:hypothetical protein